MGLTEVKEFDSQFSIDLKAAEDIAKQYDFTGRDLVVNIDLEFPVPRPMNYVLLDPVLYGTSAFVEVIDVATANEDEEFTTVDGFGSQSFDKILTPEANKFVTDDVVSATLAPSNFAYQGLGVFSFPVRIAQKLRVTLRMKDPVPGVYERMHVLTQQKTKTQYVTKSKKKGL